jgi:hypothetical protein
LLSQAEKLAGWLASNLLRVTLNCRGSSVPLRHGKRKSRVLSLEIRHDKSVKLWIEWLALIASTPAAIWSPNSIL